MLATAPAEVTWIDRSGECPEETGRAAVLQAAEGFGDALIAVEVDAVAEGLSATIRLQTPDGTEVRALQSPACSTLIEAAALITQTAAHTQVPPAPPASESDPEPIAPPAPSPPAHPPEPEEPKQAPASQPSPEAPQTTPDLRGSIRGFGFAAFGVTPRLGGGAGLAAGVAAVHWQAEVLGEYWAPTRTADTPGVRVWGWSAGLRGCGHLGPFGAVQPGLCASLAAGRLVGDAVGDVDNPRQHTDTWMSASLGPSLRVFGVPRFALVLDAEVVAVLYRPGFSLSDGNGSRPVFRSASVAPRVALGLEIRLGP